MKYLLRADGTYSRIIKSQFLPNEKSAEVVRFIKWPIGFGFSAW